MTNEFPQVLTIAGSDCDGSAGMQADMNTFFARDVYGMSVLTACVAGNSYGIEDSVTLAPDFIAKQCEVLAKDFKIRAVKTGMLADLTTIKSVIELLKEYDFGKLVVDPVIITKHGNMLLEEEAYDELRTNLLPLADIITPNFYETEKIAEIKLSNETDIMQAAEILQSDGVKNIVIKGKHDGQSNVVKDYVRLENGKSFWLSHPFVDTEHINGTGDTLSACIVAELAKGFNVEDAIRIAVKYTYECIAHPISVGHKFGPINHWAK